MSDEKLFGLSEKDYKNHLDEVEDWPKFTITNDKVSGRIPVTKIGSWKDLPSLLEEPFFKEKENDFIFRGQRKYSWSLSPTLARVDEKGVVRKEIAKHLLKEFKLKIRGKIADYSILEDSNELWSVGQHHGLRTPLIDWTKSPYVALFFAFNEDDDGNDQKEYDWEEKKNSYRCLYVLDKTFVEYEEDMASVEIFEPRMDDHGRLVSQDGLFTITSYGTTIETEIVEYVTTRDVFESLDEDDQAEEIAQYICKIYVPNKGREECLKSLRKMNVHHASLFPDLIGASKMSNHLIEEFVTDLEDEEINKFVEGLGLTGEKKGSKKSQKVTAQIPDDTAKKDYEVKYAKAYKEIVPAVEKMLIDDGLNNEIAERLANELYYNVEPKLTTDWYKRESVLASIRNEIRKTFRKFKLYVSPGDDKISKILDLFKSNKEINVK